MPLIKPAAFTRRRLLPVAECNLVSSELTEDPNCVILSELLGKEGDGVMPNTRSAKKRMRSDARKRERNQQTLSTLKTLSRKLAALAGEPQKAEEFAAIVISQYDRAVTRGIIHRNKADRKKSRITKFLKKIKSKG